MKRERRHRIGTKRRAAGLKTRASSNAALVSGIESAAFGAVGCTLLRAFGLKPIEVLATIQEKSREASNDGN